MRNALKFKNGVKDTGIIILGCSSERNIILFYKQLINENDFKFNNKKLSGIAYKILKMKIKRKEDKNKAITRTRDITEYYKNWASRRKLNLLCIN